MTGPYLLAYVFTTFMVGVACLGAALVLARLRHDELARAFLLFYVPLSVLVLAALLLAYVETRPGPSAGTIAVLEYLEAFVGRYGVMLGLPLFAHRVFAVRSRASDAALLTLVLVTLVAQHVTEFVMGGAWDERGDVAEDLVFAGVMIYTVWIALRRLNERAVYRPLGRCLLALLLLGLPVLGHDLFLVDGPGPRLYPLWYCAAGATTIYTLVGRRSSAIPSAWDLTPREEDVVLLVQRGLSTQDIARELTISPNTVKTHLRAIYDKSGFHTRVALIATLATPGAGASGSGAHPSDSPPLT